MLIMERQNPWLTRLPRAVKEVVDRLLDEKRKLADQIGENPSVPLPPGPIATHRSGRRPATNGECLSVPKE